MPLFKHKSKTDEDAQLAKARDGDGSDRQQSAGNGQGDARYNQRPGGFSGAGNGQVQGRQPGFDQSQPKEHVLLVHELGGGGPQAGSQQAGGLQAGGPRAGGQQAFGSGGAPGQGRSANESKGSSGRNGGAQGGESEQFRGNNEGQGLSGNMQGIVGSQALNEQVLLKEREAQRLIQQSRQVEEAEKLELAAREHRDKAVAVGADPANRVLGAHQ